MAARHSDQSSKTRQSRHGTYNQDCVFVAASYETDPMPFCCVQAHMDPSEIIATPFPIQNVISFTMFPVVVMMIYWLVRSPTRFSSNMISLTKASLVTFALFALCGDNLVKHWQLSLLTAIYIGALAVSTSTGKETSNILEELPFSDFSDIMATCKLYGMFLFCIPFQIMSVLDHGNQIQRWPLPMLFGGTYGYVIGTLIGLLMVYLQNNRKPSKNKV